MQRVDSSRRVLIIAPVGRDADGMASLLVSEHFEAKICQTPIECCREITRGAGALLLTEEALELGQIKELFAMLEMQPPWSELPLIILTTGGEQRLARLLQLTAEAAGGVTLLERPINTTTLLRSVEVALRSRSRQYEVRDLLSEQSRRQAELEAARTEALESARQAHESEERFRKLADDSPMFIWIIDEHANVTYANRTFLDYLGISDANQFTGKDWEKVIYPDEVPLVHEIFQRALPKQEPYSFEAHFRQASTGHYLYHLIKGVPRFVSGQFCGYMGTGINIHERKLAEKHLRESEERFRAAIETVSSIIWTNNPDGMMVGEQPGWAKFTGQSREEYQGFGWANAVHPEDGLPTINAWKLAVKEKRLFKFEHRVRRHDGEWRLCTIRAVPVFDQDDHIREWVGVHSDVTEQRRTAAALAESEDRFRAMAENIAQLAWMADAQGYIFWYNKRWYDYTGTTFEEMQGWGWEQVHDPDELQRMLPRWKQALETGQPWEDVFPLRHKDGNYGWFLSRAFPIRDETGKIVRWFGTNTDITELRETQSSLRESEAKFRQLAEAINSVFWLTDWPSRQVTYVSPAFKFLWGIEPETLYKNQNAWNERIHPEDRERVERLFLEHALTGTFDVEYRANLPVGERWIHDRCFPIRDPKGIVYRLAGVAEDITSRRLVELELAKAQQELKAHAENLERTVAERTAKLTETIGELEAFSYSVSHDMRSPLRSMEGFSRALLEEHASCLNEEGLDYLRRIERGAKRLDLLIQDVLSYSRVAKENFRLHPVDLHFLVSDTLGSFDFDETFVSIPNRLPTVLGHEALLSQVMSNLIGNAVKFTSPGVKPKIVIEAEPVGVTEVRISVTDNGIGIASSHFARIFTIFGRVYSDKKYEGTGIGLAIAKKAVERMGGVIGVESEPGKGSKFWFTIQRAE